MPYRVIMARASLVACSISLEAPVVMESKTSFLGGPAAGEGGDLVLDLLLAHQVVVALLHLHGVAQRAGGTGNDGDLLHRCGIGLLGCHQGVSDLVVGHDPLFVVGENGVLLLVACDDHLDALLQIRLGGTIRGHPGPHAEQPR